MTKVMQEGDRVECVMDEDLDGVETTKLATVMSVYADKENVLTALVYFDEPEAGVTPLRSELNVVAFKWNETRSLWVLLTEEE